MINIAVIDDNKTFADGFCSDIAGMINDEHRIDVFTDGSGFINELRNGKEYNIVFIDIILEEGDGISLASDIQAHLPDINIVFISVEQSYYMDVYKVPHLYFLTKPIKRQHLRLAVDKCLENIRPHLLTLSYNNKVTVLESDKIVYIEGFAKRSVVHYRDGSADEIPVPLKCFDEPLRDAKSFLRTHQSYIANLRYMKDYHRKKTIYLTDDTEIPISRRFAADADDAITRYLASLG